MRAIRTVAAVLGLALALPVAACAAGWGGVEPGESTLEQVREFYGAPSKETKQKVENYDTTTWIYEGPKAPAGMNRMIVEFGILKPDGFKPTVVRLLVLEPRPSIFGLQTVIDGWGLPSLSSDKNGYATMIYEEGLVVVLDKQGLWADSMTFTIPQPLRQAPAAGAASAPAPAPPRSATPPKTGSPPPGGARP